MKINYLLPNRYKKIGWCILIPSFLLGLAALIFDIQPAFLELKVPSVFINEIFGDRKFLGMVENNIFDEILSVLTIIGGLMVAFSKEKLEDEYITKIRLESLVWAVYINYAILILAIVLIYDISFLWVMIFNMFTVLFFFIIRYNWELSKLKKIADYEE